MLFALCVPVDTTTALLLAYLVTKCKLYYYILCVKGKREIFNFLILGDVLEIFPYLQKKMPKMSYIA